MEYMYPITPIDATLAREGEAADAKVVGACMPHHIGYWTLFPREAVTTTEKTLNTYQERKFSDYDMITLFAVANGTIRNSVTLPVAAFTQIPVDILFPTGYSSPPAIGIRVTYNDDTSVKAKVWSDTPYTGATIYMYGHKLVRGYTLE